MPWTSPKAGVIDRLGYVWCLSCESRAKAPVDKTVTRDPGGGGAFYLPQCPDDTACDGCGKKLVEQDLPRSVHIPW